MVLIKLEIITAFNRLQPMLYKQSCHGNENLYYCIILILILTSAQTLESHGRLVITQIASSSSEFLIQCIQGVI